MKRGKAEKDAPFTKIFREPDIALSPLPSPSPSLSIPLSLSSLLLRVTDLKNEIFFILKGGEESRLGWEATNFFSSSLA